MQLKSKILWGKLALFFVIIHFTFIILYALPDSFANARLKTYSTAYVEPIFTQKWSMFAPCPVIDGYTEVRYVFNSDDTTGWLRPTEHAKSVHSWTKGLHYGELVLAESNLIYWLSLDIDYLNLGVEGQVAEEKLSAFYQGYSYFKIKDYLFGNANYLFHKRPMNAEIRFYLKDVVTGEEHLLLLPSYTY